MILVVAPPADEHAAEVVPRLRAVGAEPVQVDLARFPQESAVALAYEPGAPPRFVLRDGGRPVELSGCEAVWWWRPDRFTPHQAIPQPELRRFAAQECHAAFAGVWHALGARFVNDPVRQDVASRKTYQLAVAQAAGLPVPRTLVANDPDEARAFLGTLRRGARLDAVQKTLTPLAGETGFTRRLRAADLDRLDTLRFAPAVLQEYVDGTDVRAVAVGGEVFAMAADAGASAHPEDCRRDWEAVRPTARPLELPGPVRRALLAVMARLGLVYGAFDLRVRAEDGAYLFLEVNPAGLWLYVEEVTGLPITDAVVRVLAGPGAAP